MMEVWDPKDKPTVLSQIKKLLSSRTGLLRMSRVCLYPGILIILILFLLIGCATFKWPWEKEIPSMNDDPDAITITDLAPLEFICTKIDCGDEDIEQRIADEQNTIACIKLQPECNIDQ
jgi:hypothetical protein